MSIKEPPQSFRSVRSDDPPYGRRLADAGSTVVILQRSEGTPLGLLADVLHDGGLDSQTIRSGSERDLPDPTEIALVISIGIDAPADPSSVIPLQTEVEWLRRADAAGASILGIGSGAQTLAIATGGGIERSHGPRHGWTWLETSEPELIAPGPWLAWYDHDILLPPAAELIAHSATAPQAFRLAQHLGLHFHPEVTPEILRDWALGPNNAGLDTQGLLEAGVRDLTTTTTNAYELLARLIASVGLLTKTRRLPRIGPRRSR